MTVYACKYTFVIVFVVIMLPFFLVCLIGKTVMSSGARSGGGRGKAECLRISLLPKFPERNPQDLQEGRTAARRRVHHPHHPHLPIPHQQTSQPVSWKVGHDLTETFGFCSPENYRQVVRVTKLFRSADLQKRGRVTSCLNYVHLTVTLCLQK